MHLTDTAIVISARKFAEHDAVVKCFTRDHGLYAGVVKGASGKSKRGIFVPGNRVRVSWRARLEEQLGTLSGELITPVAARMMTDSLRLGTLDAACALLEGALHERDAHPGLYESLERLLAALMEIDGYLPFFARFELALLAESGFGLDLESCAISGEKQGLAYVSPKSGRAATEAAAGMYREKLFALPSFLRPENMAEEAGIPDVSHAETLDALALTGYFLASRVYTPVSRKLPAARNRLMQRLERGATQAA